MIFVQQLFPHLVGLPHMKLDQVVDTNIEHNKTIGDEGITVDFRFIKVHTSN